GSCKYMCDKEELKDPKDKWACKEIGERTPKDPDADCSGPGENCFETMCCKDPGFQCYSHNKYFAGCSGICDVDVIPEDPEGGEPCVEIGERAELPDSGPTKCSWSGEDCSGTRCCNDANMHCWKKDRAGPDARPASLGRPLGAARSSGAALRAAGAAMGSACCANDGGDKDEIIAGSTFPGTLADLHASERDRPEAARGHAASAAPATTEFWITVDRTRGEKLGVDVDHEDGATLHIDRITPGLFQQWNENNCNAVMHPGDRIVEVNGARGNANQLVTGTGSAAGPRRAWRSPAARPRRSPSPPCRGRRGRRPPPPGARGRPFLPVERAPPAWALAQPLAPAVDRAPRIEPGAVSTPQPWGVPAKPHQWWWRIAQTVK
ncbi:unnamed protein product, partial [Prorocentrum cordatum]